MTLKIERISENGSTRLHLAGELRSGDIEMVCAEIEKISPRFVLDLAELGSIDLDSVRWLNACQTTGIEVENSPPYVREWMLQERS